MLEEMEEELERRKAALDARKRNVEAMETEAEWKRRNIHWIALNIEHRELVLNKRDRRFEMRQNRTIPFSSGNAAASSTPARYYGSMPLDAFFELRNRVFESHELDCRSASYTLSNATFQRPQKCVPSSGPQQRPLSATAEVFTPRAAHATLPVVGTSALEDAPISSPDESSSTPAAAGVVGEADEADEMAEVESVSADEEVQANAAARQDQIITSRVRSASSTLRREPADPNLRASSMSKGKEKSQD
jgi:hypothetical protein